MKTKFTKYFYSLVLVWFLAGTANAQIIVDTIFPLTITGGGTITLTGSNLNQVFSINYDILPINTIDYLASPDGLSATLMMPKYYGSNPKVAPLLFNFTDSSPLLTLFPSPITITGVNRSSGYPGDKLSIFVDDISGLGSQWRFVLPDGGSGTNINSGIPVGNSGIETEVQGLGDVTFTGNISIVGNNLNDLLAESSQTLTTKKFDFQINSISPSSAKLNDFVTVFGQNFPEKLGLNFVGSNIYSGENIVVNGTTLVARVPQSANYSSGFIAGTVNTIGLTFEDTLQTSFTILAPSITGVSSSLVPSKGSVTVFGVNFTKYDLAYDDLILLWTNSITGVQNKYPNKIKVLSDNAFEMVIPNIEIGEIVSIEKSSINIGRIQDAFTVSAPLKPNITNILPTAANPYEDVTLVGTNLNYIDTVKFSNFSTTNFNYQDNSKLVFYFDDGINVYTGPITVTNVSHSVVSAQQFSVIGPKPAIINSFSSNTAFPRTTITLSGKNFTSNGSSSDISSIFYNGEPFNFEVLNDSTLTFRTKSFKDNSQSSITDKFVINKAQGVKTIAVQDFTVSFPPPIEILSFSPQSQFPKEKVTISGTNLKYIETISLNDGLSDYPIYDRNEPANANDNLVITLDSFYPNAFTDTLGYKFVYSPLANPSDFSVTSITSQKLTIRPYPKPKITQVLTPVKTYPNSLITVIGTGFNAVNTVEYPIKSKASLLYKSNTYDTLVITMNTSVIETVFAGGAQKILSLILAVNGQAGYSVESSSFSVQPFDGKIEILSINKKSFDSNDKVVLTVSTSGVFLNDFPVALEFSDSIGVFTSGKTIEFDYFNLSIGSGIQTLTSINFYESYSNFVSSTEYKLRLGFSNLGNKVTNYSNEIDNISYKVTPLFNPFEPFYPYQGNVGDTIALFGYNFQSISITGVFFNNSLPAIPVFDTEQDPNRILVRVPTGGNVKGPIKITYLGGELTTSYDFNRYLLQDDNCPAQLVENWNIANVSIIEPLILNINDSAQVNIFFEKPAESVITVTSQLSDENGDFGNPTNIGQGLILAREGKGKERNEAILTNQIPVDVITKFSIKIPSNTKPGSKYAIRLSLTDGEIICFNLPKLNITISNTDSIAPDPKSISIVNTSNTQVFPTLTIGDSLQLVGIVSPSNANNTTVFWKSSNNTLASISGSGLVKAINFGVVTITAVSNTISSVTSSIVLTIADPNVTITSLEIVLANTLTGAVINTLDGTLQLQVNILPANAFDKRVLWSLSDVTLASIDTLGLVTGKKNGNLWVYATSRANAAIKDSINIILTNQYEPVLSMVIYPNFDSSFVFPKAFSVMPIIGQFTPTNATNQKFKLSLQQSADLIEEIDTLNHLFAFKSGVNANGSATITGFSLDNPNATDTIVVDLIGAEIEATDPIKNREVDSIPVFKNTCNRAIELYIDTVGKNYTGYQWYLLRSDGDSAKIVGATSPDFRPVVQGNYFVKTYDDSLNYFYRSFQIETSTPSKPIIDRVGKLDIESDTLLVASAADKYQWFVNGKLIKDATSQSLRVFYNGVYYVSITDEETNCKSVSDTVSFARPDFVDISRADLFGSDSTINNYGKANKNSLKLYPNPATDLLTVQYQSNSIRTLQVKLFNAFGLEVYSNSIAYNKNPIRKLSLPVSEFLSGLYFVQIVDGEDIVNKKILIK